MSEIHIGVDVGGTFTDIAVSVPSEGRLILHKLPSTPKSSDRAIIDGVRQVIEAHGLDPRAVIKLAHGTTVGTNALIQRRIGRVALVTSEGFRDLIEIGRQTRPKVYDIHADHPSPLVPRHLRIEVPERMLADGRVQKPLDESAVRAAGARLSAATVDCVVVCFLHSFAYPEHENRAAELLASELPYGVKVLTSSSVFPEFREYERFSTAVLNGALLTVMQAYLDRLIAGVEDLHIPVEPKISQSAGGLMSVRMAREVPIRASLSGPAAGALGASQRAKAGGFDNIITLDMGGTSADVSLLIGSETREVRERMLAGFPLRMPAIDVNAVGAGGGSIAWIDRDGLLKVGPHSAGADPGPACYGLKGQNATVTDANVVLGRLSGVALLDGSMPIDKSLAVAAVDDLAARLGTGREETAVGIIRVVSATMVKAIRSISIERGHNPAGFALFPFGGAGPLHATEVARELEMSRIVVPNHPGILCAEGAMGSDLVSDHVKSLLVSLVPMAGAAIEAARRDLLSEASDWFKRESVSGANRHCKWAAELRYIGQNYEISLPLQDGSLDASAIERLKAAFHQAHEQTYGFASTGEVVQLVNLRLKAVGLAPKPVLPALDARPVARPAGARTVMFAQGQWLETPVYRRAALAPGQRIEGPAVLEQLDTTILVHPGDISTTDNWGNLVIALGRV